MKNNSYSNPIPGIIFVIIGILILIGGTALYKSNTRKLNDSVVVDAVISRIDTERTRSNGETKTTHNVYVNFEYNDVEYENFPLSYYTSSMYEGKKLDINIYEEDNGNIEVVSSTIGIVLIAVSGFFSVGLITVGIVYTILFVKNRKENAY